MRVGAADGIALGIEFHEGLVGQRTRRDQFAEQPFGFAFDQHEARFGQAAFILGQRRHQLTGVARQIAGTDRVALAQVPGQVQDMVQARLPAGQAVQPPTARFPRPVRTFPAMGAPFYATSLFHKRQAGGPSSDVKM
ncbi:hypothetical protein LP419_15355 [Massilia sp. H-1]|nr:hypothetical protein LP419_15355 [Massilia sp. H-1]